ncbi:hypothetical protein LJC63_02200 [Ruminococcaceae bacterium OttesenSCG-928-L11]|nr:hypothetical protein [Ruminococcaceae bacterium OttesenSCG-928-L11]
MSGMNKRTVLWIILDLVFLVVFNTVFFVVAGTEHPASVWISYGFIHFSYIMVLVTPFLIRKSRSAAVFGFSLYSISSGYFFVEFIVGLIFIFIGSDSYKAALVVQIVIAGLYAVLLLSNMIANDHTAEDVERHKYEVTFIKDASSRIKLLVGKASDKKANKEIEKTYDCLHSSPTKSKPAVSSIEADILDKLSALENAVSTNSIQNVIAISKEITNLVEERNRKLKVSN